VNTRHRNQSDRPAAVALIGIGIIFLAILGRGWQGLFANYGLSVSTFLGLLIGFIAIALAYAIGSERVHQPHAKAAALAYFFFLINISALGTINAAFVTFQAGNVFREEIDRATSATIKLRDVGKTLLTSADYIKFYQLVDERWKSLKAEIENPQRCGQGVEAARRASELQEILPSFRMLSGGGQCTNIPRVLSAYEKQVSDLVKNSPFYSREKEKIEYREKLVSDTTAMLERLVATGRSVNGRLNIQDVKMQLFDNAEQYIQLRQELETKVKHPTDGIPLKIDTSAVSALGDIGQIVPFILTRIAEPSTYFYLIIALLLDLAVIAAFARVLRSGVDPRQQRASVSLRQL
jgi:hypothetical protein